MMAIGLLTWVYMNIATYSGILPKCKIKSTVDGVCVWYSTVTFSVQKLKARYRHVVTYTSKKSIVYNIHTANAGMATFSKY